MIRSLVICFFLLIVTLSWSQRPRLMVESRHTNMIQECTISDNGKYFATGSIDHTARVWDLRSGKLISILPHRDIVYSLAFMNEGQSLITGGYGIGSEAVKFWNIEQGTHQPIDMGASVITIKINSDNSLMALGTQKGGLALFNGDNEFLGYLQTGTNATIKSIDFSPEGTYCVALTAGLGDSSAAYFWELDSKELIRSVKLPPGVRNTVFINETEILYDIDSWGIIEDVIKLKFLTNKSQKWEKLTGLYAFDAGSKVAGYLNDTTVVVYETTKKKEIHRFNIQQHSKGKIRVSKDGKSLISANFSIEVFDLNEEQRRYGIDYNHVTPAMALSPNTDQLAFSGKDGDIINWNLKSGSIELWKANDRVISNLCYDPTGSYLVSTALDSTVIIWNDRGEILQQLHMYGNDFHSVTMDAQGELLVVSESDTVYAYDIQTGARSWQYDFGIDYDKNVELGLQNKYLSVIISNHIILYDLEQEEYILNKAFGDAGIEDVDFDPNEDRIALCGFNDSILVIDIKSGDEVLGLPVVDYGMSVKFHPKHNKLFIGFDLGEVGVVDLVSGELLMQSGHNNSVEKLAFNSDGSKLFSRSKDGQIIIWDANSLIKLAELYAFDDGSWAVVDEEGRYDASNGGDVDKIHFVINMRPIGLNQLKERYYEPGLLQKILGYDDEELRDVSVLGDVEMFPELELEEKGSSLLIKARSEKRKLGKIALYINDVERNPDISNEFYQDKSDSTLFFAEIDLESYRMFFSADLSNEINVIAYNVEGYMSSSRSDGELVPKGGGSLEEFIRKQSFKPKLYGIVIGTSDYHGEDLDLKYADKDAAYFAGALEQTGALLFGKENVHIDLLSTSTDSLPDKSRINRAFLDVAKQATASDVLVVYFSGHGTNYKDGEFDQFYYLTRSASSFELSDPKIRDSYAISTAEIRSWIQMNPVNKRILILDACSSGKLIEDMMTTEKGAPSGKIRALERLKDKSAMFILAGSAANKSSYEAGKYGQSLLTYSLLSGIKGQALREDHFVDVLKLFTYSVENVPRLAEYIGGIQKPILSVPSSGVSFDIGMVDETVDIRLESVKPIFIRSNFQDEDQFSDVLHLSEKVDEFFLNISEKKGGGDEFVFVDVPAYRDAYSIKGRYTQKDGGVLVRVKIFKENQLFHSFDVTGNADDVQAIVDQITASVEAMENL